MQYQGNIRKMRASANIGDMTQYQLPIGDSLVDMNVLISSPVSFQFNEVINCVHCNRVTKKSFNQGYCYPCLTRLAQCDSCIIKPELCHYDQGTCREPSWGETHCLTDHFVYLSNTGTIKVGITRHVTDGISSRWLDQGATQALPILRVKNRLVSGQVETLLKGHIADKTNWRTMLKSEPDEVDLLALKQQLLAKISDGIEEIQQQQGLQAVTEVQSTPLSIQYPVEQYPAKIKSINLDKELAFDGVLKGIKGQYLLLDGDRVINLRKYAGYQMTLTTSV